MNREVLQVVVNVNDSFILYGRLQMFYEHRSKVI